MTRGKRLVVLVGSEKAVAPGRAPRFGPHPVLGPGVARRDRPRSGAGRAQRAVTTPPAALSGWSRLGLGTWAMWRRRLALRVGAPGRCSLRGHHRGAPWSWASTGSTPRRCTVWVTRSAWWDVPSPATGCGGRCGWPASAASCGSRAAAAPIPASPRASVFREAEASLRRLGTDHLDLYQIHWPGPECDIDAAWESIGRLVEQGKVGAGGVCNLQPAELARLHRARAVCSLQLPLPSAAARTRSANCCSGAPAPAVAVLAYSPLASGILTATFDARRRRRMPGDDWRTRATAFNGPQLAAHLRAAAALRAWAAAHGGQPRAPCPGLGRRPPRGARGDRRRPQPAADRRRRGRRSAAHDRRGAQSARRADCRRGAAGDRPLTAHRQRRDAPFQRPAAGTAGWRPLMVSTMGSP